MKTSRTTVPMFKKKIKTTLVIQKFRNGLNLNTTTAITLLITKNQKIIQLLPNEKKKRNFPSCVWVGSCKRHVNDFLSKSNVRARSNE